MKKLLAGIITLLCGIVFFIIGYFYAWVSMTPNIEEDVYDRYQLIASIFVYSSFILMLGSFFLIGFAIKSRNAKDTE